MIRDSRYLNALNEMALGLDLPGQADSDLRSPVAPANLMERLWDARQDRLLAAQSTIPDIVSVRAGRRQGMTVAFGSFLGAPSVRMQLAMLAVLATSGALVLILIIALSNPFRGDFDHDRAFPARPRAHGSRGRATLNRDCPEIRGIMTIGIGPFGYVAGWGFMDGMDTALGWDGDRWSVPEFRRDGDQPACWSR